MDSTMVHDILESNEPEDFQSPEFSSVAFVGKNSKFLISIGGYVKVVTGFDFGHPIESADEFITADIPMGPTDGNGGRFNLSAKQTHLYVNFIALPGSKNEIGAFISANLLDDYLPTLQFAYLKYRGIQAGYDYSLFSDPACSAPSIDYEGPCAYTAIPVAGISYTFQPLTNWEFAAGIQLPQTSFTTIEGVTETVTQRMPDIPLAAKYSWADGDSWVRASAIFRNLTYRNLDTATNHNRFGYGFQLSGGVNFLNKLTFYYEGVWGKGIASMVQDGDGQGLDLSPTGDGRSLSPVMVWGGYCSLQYDITERVTTSATYSHFRTYAKRYLEGTTAWDDQYKYGQYVSANAFYKLTSYLDLGLEYIWGRRVNYDNLKCDDNRIQMAIQLSF